MRSIAALVAFAACLPGCPERDGDSPPLKAEPRPRVGVKVPLPDGWSAQLAEDRSFRAGPPGHAVLRIDLRPGSAGLIPSADALQKQLKEGLFPERMVLLQQVAERDFAVVVYLIPPPEDGGAREGVQAMLGAKRIGKDLFLCSTVPGASEPEVEEAAKACRELTVP